MTIDKIHQIFDDRLIVGGICKEEGLFLYNLAKKVRKGVIVEIGSADGLSTVCLALGSKDDHNIPVYSIDPHVGGMYTYDSEWIKYQDPSKSGMPDIKYYTGQGNDSRGFLENIKKFCVDDIVVPIIYYSELAYKKGLKDEKGNGKEWDLDIGLLWIDGDHRYNYVKKDIQLWAKHVIGGEKILFHDYPYPGVSIAVDELIVGSPRYCNFRGVGVDPIVNVTVRDKKEEM